ncbi:MAG TPA: hypothetical protein PKW95_14450 [bacterium]|nr:hypothetical protein [bacterium]
MKRILFLGLLCILWLALPACNEDEDPDTLTNLTCDELVEQIYDDCEITLPRLDGAYPSRAKARQYCRDDEEYDWACVDDCAFDHRGLCTSLSLCLEDCLLD